VKPRIVIICHERDRDLTPRRVYVIQYLADLWRDDGLEVEFAYGVRTFVPADVAVLHVDLSVVPERYRQFASRYPVVVNGRVLDIRKRVVSRNLVRPGDGYDGPVIVKSDLNCAGQPERRRARFPRLRRFLERRRRPHAMQQPEDYRVYPEAAAVPRAYFDDPAFVVERFLPETDGEHYAIRFYEFLGDRATGIRLTAREPIVRGANCVGVEEDEPHPDIVAARHELGFDYGKFDYVVHDGRAILLDANKTTGAGSLSSVSPETLARRRYRAEGIRSFLRA
jgi:hypothetical protein